MDVTADQLDVMIGDVLDQRQGARDKGAWTAVSTLTRQLLDLKRERAAVEDEDVSPLTAEELRDLILDLEDDLLPTATDALKERRKAGK